MLDTPFVHATMVIGPNALDAHFYERKSMEILPIERVILFGEPLRYLPTTASSRREHPVIDGERYQRREMIFGRETQKKLDDTMVAIAGLGGLECRGTINAQRACIDLAPEEVQEEIRTHNYGTRQVGPSVIFLNGVIASLQVTKLLFLLTRAP